jgi:hypothetical protein
MTSPNAPGASRRKHTWIPTPCLALLRTSPGCRRCSGPRGSGAARTPNTGRRRAAGPVSHRPRFRKELRQSQSSVPHVESSFNRQSSTYARGTRPGRSMSGRLMSTFAIIGDDVARADGQVVEDCGPQRLSVCSADGNLSLSAIAYQNSGSQSAAGARGPWRGGRAGVPAWSAD